MPQHASWKVVSVSSGADLRLSSPRRLLTLDYYAYYTVGLVRHRCGRSESRKVARAISRPIGPCANCVTEPGAGPVFIRLGTPARWLARKCPCSSSGRQRTQGYDDLGPT